MQSAVPQQSNEKQSKPTKNDAKKKIKEKKAFRVQVHCTCKRNCAQQIDVLKQQEIFEQYNNQSDWPNQTRFLRSLISNQPQKENLDPIIAAKRRENSYAYHFIDENGSLTRVCLSFFTKVLQVDRSKVFRAVDTIKRNPNAVEKRGKAKRTKNTADINHMKDFIHKFVSYDSSHKASKSNVKYLHPRLNLRKMFLLYSEDCAFKHRKVLSDTIFRKTVHDSNLKLLRKSQQKCERCEDAKKQNNLDNTPDLALNEHVDIVKSVKNDLVSSVETGRLSNDTEIFTFKLQHAIDLPHISSNDAYFKRQLWCNVFTVYDQKTDTTYFYVWNETIAPRGSNEIASCLYKHFNSHLPKDVKKIILFSDPNFGQRNITISMMLAKFFDYWKNGQLTTIEQHFFSPGHCFSGCDRSFQSVLSNIKPDQIFVQDDVINAIKDAKKNEPKFVVTAMTNRNFFSSKPLENLLLSTQKTADGNQINWSNYQKIIYNRQKPFLMDVVDYGATSTKSISLQKNPVAMPFSLTRVCFSFADTLAISQNKYDDLQSLLQYVPESHHEYYRSLKRDSNNSIKDYALVDSGDDESLNK